MKAEDRGPRFECEKHRPLFGDVPRASGPVNRECGIAAVSDMPRHFAKRAETAA
jgi:hypothetical protein